MSSRGTEHISIGQYCVAMAVAIVTLMELLDTTILNTALPAMAASFRTDVLSLRLAITSYLVTLAIFIPISGWIADRYGPKRTIIAATLVFTGSSALCGLSWTLPQLVIGRILQGIGGAMMTPVARIVLVRMFRDRGEYAFQKVVGVIAVPLVVGPVLGPVLGGWLTTNLSWHWIFFVNLPIGLAAAVAIGVLLRNEASAERCPFDWPGFLGAGAALAVMTVCLELADDPHLPLRFTAGAGLAGLALLIRVVHRSRGRAGAIFDPSLYRIPSFRLGGMLTILATTVATGMMVLIPTLFQIGFGMNPFHAGLMTVGLPLGIVTMKPAIAGTFRLVGRRRVLVLYPLLMGASMISFRCLSPQVPVPAVFLLLFVYGLWYSVHGNVVSVVPYLDVPQDRISRATSMQSTLYQFSLGLGVSFGALLLHVLLLGYNLRLDGNASPDTVLRVFHDAFTVCGVLLILISALSWACSGSINLREESATPRP
jgi:EmrB/QacA subfamily drug resistance transporter